MKVAPLIAYLTVALLDTPKGVRVAAIPSPPELKGPQAARLLSRRGADFSCCPTQYTKPDTVATSRRRSIGQVLYRRGCCSSKPEITDQIPLGELTLEDDDVSELPGQDDFHDDHMSVTGVDPDADEDPQPSTSILQSSSSAASDLVVEQSVYTGERGRQFSFNRMARDGILAEGLEGAWNAAGVKGANTRRSIDKYMSMDPPKDRLADLGPLLQPKNMDGLYETFERRVSLIKGVNPEAEKILEPFTLSGITLPDKLRDCLYYDVKVISKGENDPTKSVLELKLNYCTGIMIVTKSNSDNDLNKDSSKLYSSDLMWQTWIKYAVKSAADQRIPVKEAIASLKYILRSAVVNQETENVMRLAHLISVDHIPANAVDPNSIAKGTDGQKLGVDTGHGKWTPENVSYNYLLSTPNVRPFGMMLVDYNTALTYAYITEIHTFPRINSAPAKEEDWRDSSILLVLGKKPPGSAAQSPLHSSSSVLMTGATDASTS